MSALKSFPRKRESDSHSRENDTPRRLRFGIVASRFNGEITRPLLKGALSSLRDHGVPGAHVEVVWVPGAFELPVAALRMARSGRYQAIVAVGCILAGQTPQFEFLANATFSGLAMAGVVSGVPVTCGVITAKQWRHATARARTDGLNRGKEAAEAAWEMAQCVADDRRRGKRR